MTDLDALKAELARIQKWRMDNQDKEPSDPEMTRALLVDRLLCDLIARDGGSPEDRAWVMREMTAIHAGERDHLGKP